MQRRRKRVPLDRRQRAPPQRTPAAIGTISSDRSAAYWCRLVCHDPTIGMWSRCPSNAPSCPTSLGPVMCTMSGLERGERRRRDADVVAPEQRIEREIVLQAERRGTARQFDALNRTPGLDSHRVAAVHAQKRQPVARRLLSSARLSRATPFASRVRVGEQRHPRRAAIARSSRIVSWYDARGGGTLSPCRSAHPGPGRSRHRGTRQARPRAAAPAAAAARRRPRRAASRIAPTMARRRASVRTGARVDRRARITHGRSSAAGPRRVRRILPERVGRDGELAATERLSVLRHHEHDAPPLARESPRRTRRTMLAVVRFSRALGAQPWRSPPDTTGSRHGVREADGAVFSDHDR